MEIPWPPRPRERFSSPSRTQGGHPASPALAGTRGPDRKRIGHTLRIKTHRGRRGRRKDPSGRPARAGRLRAALEGDRFAVPAFSGVRSSALLGAPLGGHGGRRIQASSPVAQRHAASGYSQRSKVSGVGSSPQELGPGAGGAAEPRKRKPRSARASEMSVTPSSLESAASSQIGSIPPVKRWERTPTGS